MTRAQRTAIEEYGRKRFSTDMIKRMMSRAGLHLASAEVEAVLKGAGIAIVNDHATDRGFRASAIEFQRYSDPDELRARWARLLPRMKASIRAALGTGR